MIKFIKGKTNIKNGNGDLFFDYNKKIKPLKFSTEAKNVFNAGRELWRYYHCFPRVNVNASYYDIKIYFQGSKEGRMNSKSTDEEYNKLMGGLREKMKILAKAIEPKVYEYRFLLK